MRKVHTSPCLSEQDKPIPASGSLEGSIMADLYAEVHQISAAMAAMARLAPERTLTANGRHHALCIRDGAAISHGGSALNEEGDMFIAHLGHGEEWGAALIPGGREARVMMVDAAETPGPLTAVEVAAGDLHSLVLYHGGRVFSCGAGWEGPLGHGDERAIPLLRPVRALAEVKIERVAAGGSHSLAVSTRGEVYSWGWGRFGQLGHGTTASELQPRRVEALASEHVTEVVAGRDHSLMRSKQAEIFSCGRVAAGGEAHDELVPRRVTPASFEPSAATDCGGRCMRTTGGEIFSWGMPLTSAN